MINPFRKFSASAPVRLSCQAVFVSETGLVRADNQDNVLVAPKHGVFCVADGLGGGVDGGRTLGDLVDAINGEDDFPFTAAAGCVAASGTATVAERTNYTGCAVAVMRGGVTLATATVVASGLNSLAAFVDALNGKGALTAHVTFSANGQVLTATAAAAGAVGNGVEVMLRWLSPPIKTYTITLAGGEDGSGIVLTADEAGSDGNGIGVQAAGCFGVAGQFSGGTDAAGYDYGVTPFSGGGGQDIRAAYDGLLGQRSQQALPSGWRITSHRVDYDKGNEPPPCVVGVTSVGGMQSVAFVVPEGANPQQRGALVLDVDCARTVTPQVEKESWEYDTEKAKELARQEVRNAVRAANSQTEKTAPWMLVKGAAIPAGWDIASGNEKMNFMLSVIFRKRTYHKVNALCVKIAAEHKHDFTVGR